MPQGKSRNNFTFLRNFLTCTGTSTCEISRGLTFLTQDSICVKAASHYDTAVNANMKRWHVVRPVPFHRRDRPTRSSQTTNVCRSLALSVSRSALHSHKKRSKLTKLPDCRIISLPSPHPFPSTASPPHNCPSPTCVLTLVTTAVHVTHRISISFKNGGDGDCKLSTCSTRGCVGTRSIG